MNIKRNEEMGVREERRKEGSERDEKGQREEREEKERQRERNGERERYGYTFRAVQRVSVGRCEILL